MDTKGHESSPSLSPHRQLTDLLPPMRCQEGPGSDRTVPIPPSLQSKAEQQSTRPPASTSEGREARLLRLREQVQNGTYRVSAERIAEKLLLDTLSENWHGVSPT